MVAASEFFSAIGGRCLKRAERVPQFLMGMVHFWAMFMVARYNIFIKASLETKTIVGLIIVIQV